MLYRVFIPEEEQMQFYFKSEVKPSRGDVILYADTCYKVKSVCFGIENGECDGFMDITAKMMD